MDAVVKCSAFFGDPPGCMIWTVGDLIIIGDHFILGEGQMIIQNIQNIDGGVYRCSISLFGIVDSRFITVAVLERSDLAPKIVKPTSPIMVLSGGPLDLVCLLETQINNISYTWMVDSDFEDNNTLQRVQPPLFILRHTVFLQGSTLVELSLDMIRKYSL